VATFLRYWAPVLVCLGLIFAASSDRLSSRHTSRILRPLLRWLKPDISEAAIDRVQFGVRKAAHVAEYAVLAILFWRAWRKPAKHEVRPWLWKEAGVALAFAVAYAASDELHQTFVPSREGCFEDVLYDTAGALLGLLFLWRIGRWRNKW
jgi:VanZ family protein